MKRAISLVVTSVMLAASLVACGQGKPAVCTSVNDLKSSVQKVKKINPTSSGALNQLQTDLKAIKSDVAKVESDAKSQFATQIKSVKSSYSAVKASIQTAMGTPNAATLSAAAAALKSLGASIQTLVKDIEATC